jgi:hypothetical protein
VSLQTRISWGMMILQLSISPHKAEEEEDDEESSVWKCWRQQKIP